MFSLKNHTAFSRFWARSRSRWRVEFSCLRMAIFLVHSVWENKLFHLRNSYFFRKSSRSNHFAGTKQSGILYKNQTPASRLATFSASSFCCFVHSVRFLSLYTSKNILENRGKIITFVQSFEHYFQRTLSQSPSRPQLRLGGFWFLFTVFFRK